MLRDFEDQVSVEIRISLLETQVDAVEIRQEMMVCDRYVVDVLHKISADSIALFQVPLIAQSEGALGRKAMSQHSIRSVQL